MGTSDDNSEFLSDEILPEVFEKSLKIHSSTDAKNEISPSSSSQEKGVALSKTISKKKSSTLFAEGMKLVLFSVDFFY